jgi:hypothetical protein
MNIPADDACAGSHQAQGAQVAPPSFGADLGDTPSPQKTREERSDLILIRSQSKVKTQPTATRPPLALLGLKQWVNLRSGLHYRIRRKAH